MFELPSRKDSFGAMISSTDCLTPSKDDDHFHFSEALEDFAISSFDPELFTGSGLLKGHLICQVQH